MTQLDTFNLHSRGLLWTSTFGPCCEFVLDLPDIWEGCSGRWVGCMRPNTDRVSDRYIRRALLSMWPKSIFLFLFDLLRVPVVRHLPSWLPWRAIQHDLNTMQQPRWIPLGNARLCTPHKKHARAAPWIRTLPI